MNLGSSEAILFDSKETKFDSMQVELEWLAKIRREAHEAGRHQPCVVLVFLNARPPVPSEWAVVPIDFLEQLWTTATGKKLGRKKGRRR